MRERFSGLVQRDRTISLDEHHQYFLDDRCLYGVTDTLTASGLKPPYDGDDFYRQRGTEVHKATQYDDEDRLDSIDPVILPYLEAWREFKAQRNVVIWPEFMEVKLYDEVLGIAGTLDRLCLVNGRLSILDIKSGQLPAWTAIQTAGYRYLLKEPADRYAVNLRENGTFRCEPYEDWKDESIYLAAVAVETWKRNH